MKNFLIFYTKFLAVFWCFTFFLVYFLGGMITYFIMFFLSLPTSLLSDTLIDYLSGLFKIDRNKYFANLQFQHWIDICLISVHIFFICLIIYYVRNNWDKR